MFLPSAEITLFDDNIVVYKFVEDLHFFVTGGDDENELILASVLNGFFEALTILLRFLVNTSIVRVLFAKTTIVHWKYICYSFLNHVL